MSTTVHPSDSNHVFLGDVTFAGTSNIKDGSITDAKVSPGAAIDASKLDHQYAIMLSQATGTASTDETRIVHIATGAGKLVAAYAVADVACIGDSTITIDVKKSTSGGAFATLLNAVITLDSGDAAKTKVDGVPAGTATYAAGDVIEIVIDATAGTGTLGQGVCAVAYLREAA